MTPEEINQAIAQALGGDECPRYSFVCPECGSRHYSTYGGKRFCHDEHGWGCTWRGKPTDATPYWEEDMDEAWGLVGMMKAKPPLPWASGFAVLSYGDKWLAGFYIDSGWDSAHIGWDSAHHWGEWTPSEGQTAAEAICLAFIQWSEKSETQKS